MLNVEKRRSRKPGLLSHVLIGLVLLIAPPDRGVVERVVDGDTFVLLSGERVRLIGVDTPETVHPTRGEQPYGRQASDFAKQLLEGQRVRLEYDVQPTDRYGRLLAYVYLDDGRFVNAELVRLGYAQVSTYPPNVRHVETFVELQRKARAEGRGLWANAPAEGPNRPLAPAQAGTVWINPSGETFHLRTCRYVTERSSEIPRAELGSRHRACRVCRP